MDQSCFSIKRHIPYAISYFFQKHVLFGEYNFGKITIQYVVIDLQTVFYLCISF
jgi:hypothetical protein